MNNELIELKSSIDESDDDILNLIDNYNSIKYWKETKVNGLIEFISVLFETSSLLILEDMLKKGLQFNPIFKPKQRKFLFKAIRSLDCKLVKLLSIHNFDFALAAVDEIICNSTLDCFSVLITIKKEKKYFGQ